MNQTYRVFTDGSAIGNPGPGGWGAVVMNGARRREMSGGYPQDDGLGNGTRRRD